MTADYSMFKEELYVILGPAFEAAANLGWTIAIVATPDESGDVLFLGLVPPKSEEAMTVVLRSMFGSRLHVFEPPDRSDG